MPENPFSVSHLPAAADFADRTEEVARIAAAFREPGGKLLVYGERRLGKSAAVHVAADRVRSRTLRTALVNLSTASGPAEAANQILTTVHRAVGRSWMELFTAIARGLSVQVSAKTTPESGGLPTIALTLSASPRPDEYLLITEVLDAVERELARRRIRLGLLLDEFQRIHEWGGEDAEWALKGITERHRAISYVLAGSERTLIEEMISSKQRALWKLFDVLRMRPIAPPVFAAWIADRGRTTGIDITEAAAHAIVTVAGPRTRDVIQLARHVWGIAQRVPQKGKGHHASPVTLGDVAVAMDDFVCEQGSLYQRMWMTSDSTAQEILRVFAADPTVEITASATLAHYRLKSKSTVHRTVSDLVRQELLATAEGDARNYLYDDPFFRRWVQLFALGDIGLPVPPVL
ncbi:MAG TPA: hypothetical protein VNU46_02070 [Gemmatimonadaceae bacterium]|nr:hypothetical protein [Gemmatimonadaceae bacterium]